MNPRHSNEIISLNGLPAFENRRNLALKQRQQHARKGFWRLLKTYGKLPAFLTIVCGAVLGVSYWTGNMAIDSVSVSSAEVNCRRFSLQLSTLIQTPIDLAMGDSFARSRAPADTQIQRTILRTGQTPFNVSAHQSVVWSHLTYLRTSNFTISFISIALEDRVYVSCARGNRTLSGILECSLVADLLDVDGVFRRMRTVSLWDAATFSRIPWRTRGGGYESLKGPCDWMIGRGLMNPLPDGANCDFAQTNDWLNTMDGWMYAGYDPTLEPVYVAAPRAPQAMVWGVPDVSSQPAGELIVQLSRGIFDQAGMFRGVGTSSVRLQSVDDLIKAWPLDNEKATVIAFDNTGAVLGTSMAESLVTTASRQPSQVMSLAPGCLFSPESMLCRTMISDPFFFPALAELALTQDLFGEDFTDRLVILGQRYYVSKQQVPVSGSTGLVWYVILFVPNWDLQFNIWLITVPIVGGIVFLVFSFLVYSVYQKSRVKNMIRDCRNAPIIGDVALIFTDIQNSTLLWNTIPAEMKVATEQHHSIIRGIIAEYKAYEVKTIGDSFMIACKDAETAINICNAIQTRLLHADWPERLLSKEDCRAVFTSSPEDLLNGDEGESGSVRDFFHRTPSGIHRTQSAFTQTVKTVFRRSSRNNEKALLRLDDRTVQTFRGIRVRAGVHIGKAETIWDEVAKGYDYYGEVVNKAARVEGLARGGQTLVSKELFDVIPAELLEQCCTRLYGTKALKGIVGVCDIYSVLPKSLAPRDTELLRMEATLISQSVEKLMPYQLKPSGSKVLLMNSIRNTSKASPRPARMASSGESHGGGVGGGFHWQRQESWSSSNVSGNRDPIWFDDVPRNASSRRLSTEAVALERLKAGGSKFSQRSPMSTPQGVSTPMRLNSGSSPPCEALSPPPVIRVALKGPQGGFNAFSVRQKRPWVGDPISRTSSGPQRPLATLVRAHRLRDGDNSPLPPHSSLTEKTSDQEPPAMSRGVGGAGERKQGDQGFSQGPIPSDRPENGSAFCSASVSLSDDDRAEFKAEASDWGHWPW